MSRVTRYHELTQDLVRWEAAQNVEPSWVKSTDGMVMAEAGPYVRFEDWDKLRAELWNISNADDCNVRDLERKVERMRTIIEDAGVLQELRDLKDTVMCNFDDALRDLERDLRGDR